MIVNWKAFAVTATTLLVFVLETAVATDVNHSRGGRVRGLQGQGQGQGQGNGGIPPGLSRKGGTKASKQLKMNAKTGKVTGQELAALKSTGNLKNSFQAELQDLCGESTFLMNGCNVSFDLKDLTPTKSSYVFENTVSCDETIIVELIPSLTYLPQSAFMIESETGNIFELVSLPHIEDVGCMYTVISEQDVDAEALSRYKFGADSKGNSSFGQGGGNGGGKPNNPGNGGKNGNGGRNQNQSNGNEPPKWRGRRFFGSDRKLEESHHNFSGFLRNILGANGSSSLSSRNAPQGRNLQAVCGDLFTVIRMAVYYDSSFCLDYGGGTDLGSRAHIDAVIAAMNLFFQVEGLCLQIDVCEYDGECSSTLDPAQDPFLQLVQDSGSVCGTDPVLDNFKAFFANPEPQGGCDVRHLFFSLDPFPDDSTIGCAYLPGLCDEFAYAVNHVGFSRQIGFQAILVAHELGHNLNAIHTVQDCDTCIMDANLEGMEEEFGADALDAISNFVVGASKGSDTCTASSDVIAPTVAPISTPSPSISTDRSCYEVGDPILIDWFYESCRDGDWIGIYADSETNPLGGDWLLWVYARTTTQSFDTGCNLEDIVVFYDNSVDGRASWPLPEGTYRTWIARDDSEPYTAVLAGPSFEIAATCNVPGCNDDADWQWTNNRGRVRDCATLASRPDRFEDWCPRTGDSPDTRTGFEACLKACFNCEEATLPPVTSAPKGSPFAAPSMEPSAAPSDYPSANPSARPSGSPSTLPSSSPSANPSSSPSANPSSLPSTLPSASPSDVPSESPSSTPSTSPTDLASSNPTVATTPVPKGSPTIQPSSSPSAAPSSSPSASPSDVPSALPSLPPSLTPSASPSAAPSASPSDEPSAAPSAGPSSSPSAAPSSTPSAAPSSSPSASPSDAPSASPSDSPSASPSEAPSTRPSSSPSALPSSEPSNRPSSSPSALPTNFPTVLDLPNLFTPCMVCDEVGCDYDSSCSFENSCTADGGSCELCKGDCDVDSDCPGSQVCYQRDAGDFKDVPGCAGGEHDGSRTDYCVEPFNSIHVDQSCYARGDPITVCFDYTNGRRYDWIGCYAASETSPLGDDYLLWVYTSTQTQNYVSSIEYYGCVTFEDSSFGAWPLSNGTYKCWIARDDGGWTGVASSQEFSVGLCSA